MRWIELQKVEDCVFCIVDMAFSRSASSKLKEGADEFIDKLLG